MNPEAQKVLEEILKKDAEGLTQYEIDFLNARASYLNNRQRAEFASVLRKENALPLASPASVAGQPTQFTNPQPQQAAQAKEGAADTDNAYSNTQGLDEEDA